MAFPGPFDYERGICLIRGLDKYESLYGTDLRRELSGRLGIGPERIRFANDAAAFALGEMGFGQARGAERVLCVCIGTGCGSAFGVGGELVTGGMPGVPKDGYLYGQPFLEGCIDDAISRRGLMALTKERLGEALDGKALARRALDGDDAAGKCFLAFGGRLRDALEPFLEAFRPEALCLGGRHGQRRPVPGPGGGALHGGGDTGLHHGGHLSAHAPGADPYLCCLTISPAVRPDCITLTGSIA